MVTPLPPDALNASILVGPYDTDKHGKVAINLWLFSTCLVSSSDISLISCFNSTLHSYEFPFRSAIMTCLLFFIPDIPESLWVKTDFISFRRPTRLLAPVSPALTNKSTAIKAPSSNSSSPSSDWAIVIQVWTTSKKSSHGKPCCLPKFKWINHLLSTGLAIPFLLKESSLQLVTQLYLYLYLYLLHLHPHPHPHPHLAVGVLGRHKLILSFI